MNIFFYAGLLLCCLSFSTQAAPTNLAMDPVPYREWIAQMKTAEHGPFKKIAWFCKDGTILPPKPHACREHGGGRQHGVWNERVVTLREAGYRIANILAATTPEAVLADNASELKWILLERFMLAQDDGWILRQARHYRGALQSEEEAASARVILQAMLARPVYRDQHFLLTREATRLLPWRAESQSLDKARSLSSTIAERDTSFTQLRNKIHGFPEKADISAVRAYRERRAPAALLDHLQALEDALRASFESPDLVPALRKFAATLEAGSTGAGGSFRDLAARLDAATASGPRLALLGEVLAGLRDGLPGWSSNQALHALDLSLVAEQAAMAAALELLGTTDDRPRAELLDIMADNLQVLYGLGLLSARERDAQRQTLENLAPEPALLDYRETLDYLALVPAWSDAWLQFFFAPEIAEFDIIEPRIHLFNQDRLRGSPLLLHGQLLERLSSEADRIAGVEHEIMGTRVNLGLRALNPGVARGQLVALEALDEPGAGSERAIVIAPETIADLPPVAGILTARAGNALSHIQLLARNLGIPNVVVSAERLAQLQDHIGARIVMLVSPGGVVRLLPDAPEWDALFPAEQEKPVTIRVDLDKLVLGEQSLLTLDELRADDSGRVVGPKAAKLGELKAHYPDQVSQGLAIPFGVFRQMLERIEGPQQGSLYEWMRQRYRDLATIDDPGLHEQATRQFLTKVRDRIQAMTIPAEFREQLRLGMRKAFGEPGEYGVFVRSDTNVEDLPGFTGAGLNLTVPNVVGFEAVLEAIKAVWASPFTERAYGWRQALMEQPEHVYASVLLHKTVPADKSGVMVTADISNNDPDVYTVVSNEGIGGGVEGQAAETLKINPATGTTTLLASATESHKMILPPTGGIERVRTMARSELLTQDEFDQLLRFGQSLAQRYPPLLDAEGQVAPADIEFGFVDGQLYIIQIRPFLQSRRAQRNEVLLQMDAQFEQKHTMRIDLTKSINGNTP